MIQNKKATQYFILLYLVINAVIVFVGFKNILRVDLMTVLQALLLITTLSVYFAKRREVIHVLKDYILLFFRFALIVAAVDIIIFFSLGNEVYSRLGFLMIMQIIPIIFGVILARLFIFFESKK